MIYAVILSLLAHAALVAVAGRVAVQSPARGSQIFVTILESVPPPPPPPAPVASGPQEQVVPVRPASAGVAREEKPRERSTPKIARKVEPRERSAPRPPPQIARDGAAAGGASNGMADGVAGGEAGGLAGGVVGGRGRALYGADEVASPPVPISQTRPDYPPLARVRGIEGLVVVEAVVDQRGFIVPSRLRVAESVPFLDEAALRAVERWRFKPGRDRNGDTVRVLVQVPIRFRLR
jgi:protein TonB